MRKITFMTGLLLLLLLCGCAEKTGTDGRAQESFDNPPISQQQDTAPQGAPEAEQDGQQNRR